MFGQRRFPAVTIPEPCHQEWEGMEARDRVRFCTSCQEAAALLKHSPNGICGRIVRDVKGELVFRREPPNPFLQRLVQISLLGVSAFGAEATAQQTSCKVRVRAVDATSAGVAGAKVSIGGTPGGILGTTDQDGYWNADLPVGLHNLTVSSPGFVEFRQQVGLSCDTKLPKQISARLFRDETVGSVNPPINMVPMPVGDLTEPRAPKKRNLFHWLGLR